MTRSLRPAALVLALLLGVSACTRSSAPPPPVAVVAPVANQVVVVTIRPVPAATRSAGSDVRGTILGAVGSPPTAMETEAAFEFIVRQDSGETISVVQTNEAGLQPGEHVVLSTGPWTRLSRAGN